MKLYELKRGSSFRIPGDDSGRVFKLRHVDGMYSLCTDPEGNTIHIAAFQRVEPVKAGAA